MDLRPAFQLQTVIKALTDVVLPAVDPGNKLAQEQGRLALGMLGVLQQRLPLMYRYDCDEVRRYLELAAGLAAMRGGARTQAAAADLSASAGKGAEVLARAKADPAELEAAGFDLRAKVGELVAAAYTDGEAACLPGLSQAVLAAARLQTDRERAWMILTGFEADPAALKPIEQQLGSAI